MATASPSAVLAVPDRPLAERPEARASDGSDGQFAGLMAQFVQTPAASKASEPVSKLPAKVEKEPKAPASESHAVAFSAASSQPGPKVDSANQKAEAADQKTDADSQKVDAAHQKAEAANQKADAANSKAEAARSKTVPTNSKAEAATPKADATSPKVVTASLQVDAPTLVEGGTNPKLDATPPIVMNDPSPKPEASRPVISVAGHPVTTIGLPPGAPTVGADPVPTSQPGDPTTAKVDVGEVPPPSSLAPDTKALLAKGVGATIKVTLAPQVASPSSETPPPAVTLPQEGAAQPGPGSQAQATAALPNSVPLPSTTLAQPLPLEPQAKAPATPPGPIAQPVPQTPVPVDPATAPPPAMIQAVLAESGPRVKEAPKAESQVVSTEGPKADASHAAEKVPSSVRAQAVTPEPIRAPGKAESIPTPLVVEPETTASGTVKTPASPTTAEIEGAPPTFEALLAKTSAAAQTALLRAPDGSSLAALNTLPRTVETAVGATPVAAPTPAATPPTAPVLQVEGGLRWMLKGGAQEAQLQLHPDSLGQVTIHLKVEGGEVHARLWITEPGSVQAVQEGRPHLEMCLKEQGLQLGSFDLHQGRRPFQEAPSAPSFREGSTPEAVPARQEAPSTILPSILNPHRVELYA